MARAKKKEQETSGEVTQVDGNEKKILDVLLAAAYPAARVGNATAIEQVLRIMELRLKHTRQNKADQPW